MSCQHLAAAKRTSSKFILLEKLVLLTTTNLNKLMLIWRREIFCLGGGDASNPAGDFCFVQKSKPNGFTQKPGFDVTPVWTQVWACCLSICSALKNETDDWRMASGARGHQKRERLFRLPESPHPFPCIIQAITPPNRAGLIQIESDIVMSSSIEDLMHACTSLWDGLKGSRDGGLCSFLHTSTHSCCGGGARAEACLWPSKPVIKQLRAN